MRAIVLIAVTVLLGLVDLSTGQLYLPAALPSANRAAATTPRLSTTGARSSDVNNPPPPKYLNSYFPAAMHLLHYYSERMQYQELVSTTVAPPYTGGDYEVPTGTTAKPASTTKMTTTTARTTMTTTTTTRPPPTTTTVKPSTTARPTTRPPPQIESTTAIHAPGLFAPVPPQYQMLLDEQAPHNAVHVPTSTRRPATSKVTRKPPTNKPPSRMPTTKRPKPTTQRPTTWTSTRRPITTTKRRATSTTKSTKRPHKPHTLAESEGFLSWFFESRPSQIKQQSATEEDREKLYDILDPLPKELLNDIDSEGPTLPAQNDEDNVREFLKKYDDSFGRFVPSQTGNKVKPPTKPYVDFLSLYDLMKREAKTLELNNYHGYSDDVLSVLHATSSMSSERQLHYVLSQVQGSSESNIAGIKSRMSSIIKDLENPYSPTAKAIRYIPTLQFSI